MAGELNEANDGARASHPRVDRRTMIKSAAAVGAGAVAWSAPRIETLGFAPAAAAGTPCEILSPASDDKNSQLGQNQCPRNDRPCCGQSFGDAGKIDRFTFTNPTANCSQLVVRTIALDCDTGKRNPDIGQFALIIESSQGSGCANCTIDRGVLVDSRQRTELDQLDNGDFTCPSGSGVDASILDCSVDPDARLAVVISCVADDGTCVVIRP